MAKKLKRVKQKSLSSLKAKAWKLFSEYIRRRETDYRGYVKCCTCHTIAHWKEMDAGHFISGRTNAVLFDERGVHAQCKVCNIWKRGNYVEYTIFMLERYGRETVDDLRTLKHATRKITRSDYEYMIETFKEKLNQLEEKPRLVVNG